MRLHPVCRRHLDRRPRHIRPDRPRKARPPAPPPENTGVSGRPLPAVIWLTTVHCFSRRPRQPLSSVPPCRPWPVVYCNVAVTRCRWSNVEGPRSPRRFNQFCAIEAVGPLLRRARTRHRNPPPPPAPVPPSTASSSSDFENVYCSVAVSPTAQPLAAPEPAPTAASSSPPTSDTHTPPSPSRSPYSPHSRSETYSAETPAPHASP